MAHNKVQTSKSKLQMLISYRLSGIGYQKKGFTLIELLVVISIIGILMAIALVSFNSTQIRSRDARRRSDMKAMQTAFEEHYSTNGSYSNASTCSGMASNFVGGMPLDPKNVSPNVYTCRAVVGDATTTDTYCACARLEFENGNSNRVDCGGLGSVTTGDYFCVRNLQ